MKMRSQAFETARLREFDVVVIGGGIVGAGVAQDAATRGLSCLLVEKEDFASGTSSRTTKLIHGGLRYLEQLHFGLTRELCQERGLLEQLAPHMVRDFSFVLPLLKNDPIFGVKASIGLTLYDVLAWNVSSAHRHTRINLQELLQSTPSLSPDNITGGLKFHDCITDDSRLVLEVIKSACAEGAQAINYLEVTGFDTEDGQVRAVKCHDRYSGDEVDIRCKVVVNAAGVWSDDLMQLLHKDWGRRVAPAKGTHIVVAQSAFETNTALFLPAAGKRYVFVVPWQRALMIGTTDTLYSGRLNNPVPVADEIDYLLSVVNSYSNKKLNKSDVIAAWSGLRPLIGSADQSKLDEASQGDKQKEKSTSGLSREHEIFEAPGGIIGLIGAKLTNYRIVSNQVVDKIIARLPPDPERKLKQTRTKRIMLGGWANKSDFLTLTASIAMQARKMSIEPATLDHLIATYGKDAQTILDIVEQEPSLNARICPDFPPIMAEVPFCILHEMAVSLEDILCRRIRLGIVHQRQCLEAAPKVAALVQKLLGWDKARAELELAGLEQTLKQQMESFSPVKA
jgi:glycerol-3-phosphate dehydrogenase